MAAKRTAAADVPEREVVESPQPEEKTVPAGGMFNGAPAGAQRSGSGGEKEEGTEQSGAFGEARSEAGGVSSDVITLVYIGPSLPYGKLRSSMVLKGTEEEIRDFLADVREKYPEVDRLTVPPEQLTQALEKVGRKGTILHKYYEDMLAKSRASRKG